MTDPSEPNNAAPQPHTDGSALGHGPTPRHGEESRYPGYQQHQAYPPPQAPMANAVPYSYPPPEKNSRGLVIAVAIMAPLLVVLACGVFVLAGGGQDETVNAIVEDYVGETAPAEDPPADDAGPAEPAPAIPGPVTPQPEPEATGPSVGEPYDEEPDVPFRFTVEDVIASSCPTGNYMTSPDWSLPIADSVGYCAEPFLVYDIFPSDFMAENEMAQYEVDYYAMYTLEDERSCVIWTVEGYQYELEGLADEFGLTVESVW